MRRPVALARSWRRRTRRWINRVLALHNHRRSARRAAGAGAVLVEPVPPRGAGGDVEHYHHFLFDLALPLQGLLQRLPRSTAVEVREIGVLTPLLSRLFPDVRILARSEATPARPLPLVGMNPVAVAVPRRRLEAFRGAVFERLGIGAPDGQHEVLLIERGPPHRYYRTEARQRGAGTDRRSILNHDELAVWLRARVAEPLRFHDVRLEELPLERQVSLFRSARLVVGQHGAGLSNAVWMEPGATLVELRAPPPAIQGLHFQALSALRRLRYARFPVEGDHVRVPVDRFAAWWQERDLGP